MFKNLMIYALGEAWHPQLADVEAALQTQTFTPCTALQDKSVGWVPPRGQAHGALVEAVAGHWVMRLMIETRSVPASVVRREAEQRIAEIEQQTGIKPGRKQRRDILDDVRLALLPQAFARQIGVWVWVDREQQRLLVDAGAQGRADEVVSALMKTLPGLQVSLLHTTQTPQSAMTGWLLAESPDEWPEGLHVERDGLLKAMGDEPASIRYSRHPLTSDDVREHVRQGRLPVQMAMSWNGLVGFVLTDTMQIKRIRFLDGSDEAIDDQDRFDADVVLATGHLGPLLDGLIEALGGRLESATMAALNHAPA